MSEYLGCGDNGCLIERPKGVGTNGTCRCFNDLPQAKRMRVQKGVMRLNFMNKELLAAVTRLQERGTELVLENRDMRKTIGSLDAQVEALKGNYDKAMGRSVEAANKAEAAEKEIRRLKNVILGERKFSQWLSKAHVAEIARLYDALMELSDFFAPTSQVGEIIQKALKPELVKE